MLAGVLGENAVSLTRSTFASVFISIFRLLSTFPEIQDRIGIPIKRGDPMSAFGTKRTFVCAAVMSAFGGKADIWQPSLIDLDL